jgi:hypothetical protein
VAGFATSWTRTAGSAARGSRPAPPAHHAEPTPRGVERPGLGRRRRLDPSLLFDDDGQVLVTHKPSGRDLQSTSTSASGAGPRDAGARGPHLEITSEGPPSTASTGRTTCSVRREHVLRALRGSGQEQQPVGPWEPHRTTPCSATARWTGTGPGTGHGDLCRTSRAGGGSSSSASAPAATRRSTRWAARRSWRRCAGRTAGPTSRGPWSWRSRPVRRSRTAGPGHGATTSRRARWTGAGTPSAVPMPACSPAADGWCCGRRRPACRPVTAPSSARGRPRPSAAPRPSWCCGPWSTATWPV